MSKYQLSRIKMVICFSALLLAVSAGLAQKTSYKSHLVWSEEFNNNGLPDSTAWRYETGSSGWGNHELENYTANDTANAIVKDGALNIVVRKNENGYTSARLILKQSFLYGRIEIRAQLPAGRGLWPAIWMMPAKSFYGDWPKSGEIDIMEQVGYNPDSVFFTVHTGKYNHVMGTQKSKGSIIHDPYGRYHVFAMERHPDRIDFFMDDTLQFSFKNEHTGYAAWPFDKPFNLILNVAVGGDWGGKMGVDDAIFPAAMKIDYVRFYKNLQ